MGNGHDLDEHVSLERLVRDEALARAIHREEPDSVA
jgi:hypothetical protein